MSSMMRRLVPLAAAGCGLAWGVATPAPAPAQVAAIRPNDPKPEEPWKPKDLELTPMSEPVPALRYRFLPNVADLTPGDAAPIYLRTRHEMGRDTEKLWGEFDVKAQEILDRPIGELPIKEVEELIQPWRVRLRLIEFGSRREYCDWSYTLPEQRLEAIEILLPDAQEMRRWARMLALKARLEIAKGEVEAATGTIETGLAFGRHVASGPFLINKLVGIAICMSMLNQAEELVARPDAPNLYWALTVLPRPMVDLRPSMELEQRLVENMVPEMNEADGERSDAEWAAIRERLLARLGDLSRKLAGYNDGGDPGIVEKARAAWEQVTQRPRLLAEARAFLRERRGMTAEQVDGMNEDRAIVLYIAETYREARDAAFKACYLPFRESKGVKEAAEKLVEAVKAGPLKIFAEIQPATRSAALASEKLDRRIAILRVVEAVRLQAAAHGGQLPDELADVTIVPVPDDPATGRPFDYKRDGDSAVLSGDRIENQPKSEVGYRIVLRKQG